MRALPLIIATALVALVLAAPASANDRFTLDTAPGSAGHIVVDSAGTAYVAWTHRSGTSSPDSVMFCEIPGGGTCTAPRTLPIPGAVDQTDDVAGAFPVLGSGGTVYVVAPRYVKDDVVIWTSPDGGQSFNGGVVAPNEAGYSNKSEPTDVFLSGTEFLIGAFNPGIGFSTQPAGGGAGMNLKFPTLVTGTVGSASMALSGPAEPLEAYWLLEGSEYTMYLLRYKGGPLTTESSWEGPISIGKGYETKLAGGAAGTFLVSQDYAGGASSPTAVEVRRYTGSGFGAPLTLANDTSTDLFAGGAIAESPGGRLAVAWPGTRATDQARVMRLFSSSDGGNAFTETDIAHLGHSYAVNDNAQLAITDSGAGWITFIDEAGLQMADTAPIAPPPSPVPSPYKGTEKTIGKPVGGFELTLRLPKSCLQPGQAFYAGAGKRVRHKVAKALRSKLTLKTAAFAFDGRKLKTLKKKPLKLLIEPGTLASGSTHTVTVKVTAIALKHGKKKKVVRTLKGTVSIC